MCRNRRRRLEAIVSTLPTAEDLVGSRLATLLELMIRTYGEARGMPIMSSGVGAPRSHQRQGGCL